MIEYILNRADFSATIYILCNYLIYYILRIDQVPKYLPKITLLKNILIETKTNLRVSIQLFIQ